MMAIYVGAVTCSFCGKKILKEDAATHLPQFVWNEADPLFQFGDSCVHDKCLNEHSLSNQVRDRLKEFEEKTSSENRECFICKKQIKDPENYIGLGYLTGDIKHSLYRFNYAHFHRSCIHSWKPVSVLLDELEYYDRSGAWKGGGLKWLIEELRKLSVIALRGHVPS